MLKENRFCGCKNGIHNDIINLAGLRLHPATYHYTSINFPLRRIDFRRFLGDNVTTNFSQGGLPMGARFDPSPLVDNLCVSFSRYLGLSRRGFAQLLHANRFSDGLAAFQGQRTSCAQAVQACAPILQRLCPEPQEGWLRFIYDTLAAVLFPDPNRPPATQAQERAMAFYLQVLEWLLDQEGENCPFDPLLDPHWATGQELEDSRIRQEYLNFQKAVRRDHFPALLRIGRECMPFDPASHTIGVNNVAVHGARLAKLAGLSVDIPLVSAASLSHDIGKFGCRGKSAPRTPYLHYYFTWQYLAERELPHIAHVAANHSTWDLEFENLPVESLLLIYADFRVRGTRGPDGKETTKIYSLADSYAIILSKLADVTPEKQRRYATVYAKLRDFESFLSARGVCPRMEVTRLQPVAPFRPALCSEKGSITGLRHLTFDNSLRLMDTFSTDASFEQLLEQARSEKNLQRIRTYLLLFEEYNSYMPKHSKGMTLSFLYELLMHREGDIRRRAAKIMGQILANSGPSYRKELPADAPATAYAPTLMGYFAEAERLWEEQIRLCLYPDRKISAKHAQRISNSLKGIAESLFSVCSAYDAQVMARPLLRLLKSGESSHWEALASALAYVPAQAILPEDRPELARCLGRCLAQPDIPLRLTVIRCLSRLMEQDPAIGAGMAEALRRLDPGDSFAVSYAKTRILNRFFGGHDPLPQARAGELFLSNLKNVVPWTVKLVQIDFLWDQVRADPAGAFHTAMHLSNLLSVSEHLTVREYAGYVLLQLTQYLTVDQKNEILVDLTRELETGQEQISYYIPPFLGRLLCQMPDKELAEGVDYLDDLIHAGSSGSLRAANAALHTLGAMMTEQCCARAAVFDRVLGLLLTGVAHYEPVIHQTALSVLCRGIFGNPNIAQAVRRDCLVRTGKKLLCLLSEPTKDQLTFYNHAAMLNHLYRLIVSCEVSGDRLRFPPPRPVAFFPGTFDPFSAGHKQIVRDIHALGFEVYLAIDEFSWSKRTIPKLLRRKIAAISTADLWDVYLFPDNCPVNIACPEDLAALAAMFPGRELYLAAGSDVIEGASAYRTEAPGSARDYNHVIFRRAGSKTGHLDKILRGKWKVMSLPAWCEGVSSTRIREYVDKDMDISMLVDPIVQAFIYERGLYLRSPQFKNELKPGDLYFSRATPDTPKLPPLLQDFLRREPEGLGIFLSAHSAQEPLGWVCGHTVTSSRLLETLGSRDAAAYVRRHTSGKIMMVDHVSCVSHADLGVRRQLVNELLARSLETDHTYALCRCSGAGELYGELLQLGFLPIPGQPDLLSVDMRSPMVLVQDVFLWIKEPLRSDKAVGQAVEQTRLKLRGALAALFPGRLLLSFDAETLNQSLSRKVQRLNQVDHVPPGVRQLGPYMCVPYGKILSDEVVPNTVTKTLHADKVYQADMSDFRILEAPGYSSLSGQVRTIKSFRRPVILVDDLLHNGHRIHAMDHIFKEEHVEIRSLVVGLISGHGQDLMQTQGRHVECEYFIPNLNHWLTESGLYPFLGGDSMDRPEELGWNRPSINLVLPYVNPTFIPGADGSARLRLSLAALENARDILLALERRHLAAFSTNLTLERLPEALFRPRLPDRGRHLQYDFTVPASSYVSDDLTQLQRISMSEVIHGL